MKGVGVPWKGVENPGERRAGSAGIVGEGGIGDVPRKGVGVPWKGVGAVEGVGAVGVPRKEVGAVEGGGKALRGGPLGIAVIHTTGDLGMEESKVMTWTEEGTRRSSIK